MHIHGFSRLMLIMVFSGCAPRPSLDTYTDPDTGFTAIYEVDAKTGKHEGPYTITDSTGMRLERGTYHANALHGIRELFYPDSTVKVRERYSAGEMVDLYEYFRPDGSLELSGYYIDGTMYGLWRTYDEAGNLVEEVFMAENEERGPFREYYPDGKLKAQGTYLQGPNEEGLLYLYAPTGELQKKMLCRNGRCVTLWTKP